MSFKKAGMFGLKTITVSVAMLITVIVVTSLVPNGVGEADMEGAGVITLLLLAVTTVDALIIGLVVKNSRWSGWVLTVGLILSFFGTQTLVGQIEAIVFLTPLGENMGAGNVPVLTMPLDFILSQILIWGAAAVVGVSLAVFLFGKIRKNDSFSLNLNLGMSTREWLFKLAAIILLYELLYFGFGYFVAWKSPAVLEFYQGTDPGSFFAQMRNVATNTPGLIPFQAFRALLWAAFALPVIGTLRHRPWIGALLTGLFLSLPMNIPHIVPNQYMPADVRFVHFVETASSTFIFGILAFFLLYRSHRSVLDLFRVRREEVAEVSG